MKEKIEHYTGSLDFPCDICNSNSYDNYHFIDKYDQIRFVACKKCILKSVGD